MQPNGNHLGMVMVVDLINAIVKDGVVPTSWEMRCFRKRRMLRSQTFCRPCDEDYEENNRRYNKRKSIISMKCVNNLFANKFEVIVGVYQLCPLLIVIALEGLSSVFRARALQELLHAENLVLVAETENESRRKLADRKENLERKDLSVNIGKTKVMT